MFFIITAIAIILILLGIYHSKVEIEIKDLDISTLRENKINNDYEIIISLVILEKIKILKIKMTKNKMRKAKIAASKKIKDININFINKQKLNIRFENLINDLQPEINKLDMYLEIGIEDAALTAISVGGISSLLGIFLRDKITAKDRFEIRPIYIQKNLINLRLNCIFRIKLIHYICKNILKERGKKNERKSSDRRAYVHCNE